jgi:hypothetical protein
MRTIIIRQVLLYSLTNFKSSSNKHEVWFYLRTEYQLCSNLVTVMLDGLLYFKIPNYASRFMHTVTIGDKYMKK